LKLMKRVKTMSPEENKNLKDETRKLRLTKEAVKKYLDTLDSLLKDDLIFFTSDPSGFKIKYNIFQLKKKYPQIKISILSELYKITSDYIRFSEKGTIYEFYEEFESEQEREKAKEIINVIKKHKNSHLLAFRITRSGNSLIGNVDVCEKKYKIETNPPIELSYYDIFIPYCNDYGKEKFLRLEIDRIELEALTSSLSSILKDKNGREK